MKIDKNIVKENTIYLSKVKPGELFLTIDGSLCQKDTNGIRYWIIHDSDLHLAGKLVIPLFDIKISRIVLNVNINFKF